MKKTILFLIITLCFAIANTAHTQETIKNRTSNPQKWAEENKQTIQKMDWYEWLKLDKDHRMPAFMQTKPEQRHILWLQKLEDAMKLDWKKGDLSHIQKIYNKIKDNPNWFLEEKEEDREKLQKDMMDFFNQWAEYATKELKWEQKRLYGLIMDLGKVIDTEGNLDTTIPRCGGSCPIE